MVYFRMYYNYNTLAVLFNLIKTDMQTRIHLPIKVQSIMTHDIDFRATSLKRLQAEGCAISKFFKKTILRFADIPY